MSKLYFRYGAMGSGKSIDLLKVAHNYEEKGQRVVIITAGIDDRYGVGKITTRIGLQREAEIFNKDVNIFELVKNYKYVPDSVLIDEAQFLTKEHVYQISDIVDILDIPVMCYGLRADFRLEFFEGSLHLMEIADKIEEIKTVCECGSKATCNMRMLDGKATNKGDQILIGGNDSYKSVCRKCYKKYIKEGMK